MIYLPGKAFRYYEDNFSSSSIALIFLSISLLMSSVPYWFDVFVRGDLVEDGDVTDMREWPKTESTVAYNFSADKRSARLPLPEFFVLSQRFSTSFTSTKRVLSFFRA